MALTATVTVMSAALSIQMATAAFVGPVRFVHSFGADRLPQVVATAEAGGTSTTASRRGLLVTDSESFGWVDPATVAGSDSGWGRSLSIAHTDAGVFVLILRGSDTEDSAIEAVPAEALDG